jgi:hypothetical protein
MAKRLTWRVPKSRLFSTPVPKETRTYKPVSHRELAEATIIAIKDAGFELGAQEYSWAKEGLEANARYTIRDIRDSEMELEIGWQNSYNKQLSLKFAIGTRIMICANGCVSGNFGSFKKKHMGEVAEYAPAQIGLIIGEAEKTFKRMQEERDLMKSIELSGRAQAELIGRLFLREQLINSTQLNLIRDEFNKPSFDYGAPNSLWEVYQHTTFSMKHIHPRLWMDDHISVHRFFTGVADEFTGKATPLEVPAIIGVVEETTHEVIDPDQLSILDAIDELD